MCPKSFPQEGGAQITQSTHEPAEQGILSVSAPLGEDCSMSPHESTQTQITVEKDMPPKLYVYTYAWPSPSLCMLHLCWLQSFMQHLQLSEPAWASPGNLRTL
jgi:hypothetical protein